jgi:LysR family transcriptional regulator of abg operon
MIADKLVMIKVSETLPKATYYLIQRRDTRQTPLTASLITQFRRQSRNCFPPRRRGQIVAGCRQTH